MNQTQDWPAHTIAMPDYNGNQYGGGQQYDDDPVVGIIDGDTDYDKPKKSGKKGNNNNDNNNNAKKNEIVDIRYEACSLEKAPPQQAGEKSSWHRVGKRSLPFSEKDLLSKVKTHREKTGLGPIGQYENLTTDMRGVIDRVVKQCQEQERQSNAEWILLAIERKRGIRRVSFFKSQEYTTALYVYLKRQNKNQTKPGSRTAGAATFYDAEIIDLSKPLKETKKDNKYGKDGNQKKGKKNNDSHDYVQYDDYNVGPDQYGQQQTNQYQPNQQMPPMGMPPMPAPYPPPQDQSQQQAPMPPPQDDLQDDFPGYPAPHPPSPQHGTYPSARNELPPPFDPNYAPQEQYGFEPPRPEIRHDVPPANVRSHSRSRSRERRRRLSLDRRNAQVQEALLRKVDELGEKIDGWHMNSDSSEQDSIFSHGETLESFSTPPSPGLRSPRRGSLHEQRSSQHFGRPQERRRYPGRYGDRDVDYQPAYTPQRRRSERRNSHPERPRLLPRATYDDYPGQRRGHDSRTVPVYREPRRIADYAENLEYAGFARGYGRREPDSRERDYVGAHHRRDSYEPMAHEAYDRGQRDYRRASEFRPGRSYDP